MEARYDYLNSQKLALQKINDELLEEVLKNNKTIYGYIQQQETLEKLIAEAT